MVNTTMVNTTTVNTKNTRHDNLPFSDKIHRLCFKWASMVILLSLSLIIPFIVLTGCSSSEQKKLPPYKLIFNTTNNVNDSSPLKMHVVLLKSTSAFMSADFFSLQGNAQAALGNNLLDSQPFFLLPSQHPFFLMEKNQPEANYIGIFAEYKQLDGKRWRIALQIIPLPEQPAFYKFWASPPDTLDICIQVTANGLNFINKCS
ncbi:type VI secretion system lipoprotein TssJ [Xenorhabdus sp. IM139775]|uniref:type VI secretion system lipoprotein TssJ n=1 Tax=Xenorhabdus sp. IM139775 TaxID=3025876 RepID=UPI0023592A71|nr:type VI secretion system lipoprotein TssJ [Xenorhabdus sp. IM139775]MDC9592080.1 type VI secretion system lipoprotein TssJ [Xenorhabdus sp. IM139775]